MPDIIGLCGLPGAGKTTIAEALTGRRVGATTPAEIEDNRSVLDYIVSIIQPGVRAMTATDLRYTVHELLKNSIDPLYHEIVKFNREVGSHSCRFYIDSYDSDCTYVEQFFSFAVKQITCALFGFSWEIVCAPSPALREMRDTLESGIRYRNVPNNGIITARQALQYIGTDVFRVIFDADIWLSITMGKIHTMPDNIKTVIISDVRFANEARVIASVGGKILHIYRDASDLALSDDLRRTHPSNWSFLEFPEELIHARIHNGGTIEDLLTAVRAYLA